MSDDSNYPPVSPIAVGLMGRCPRCGNGKLFNGFLTVAPACDVCGLDYGFADAGDGPGFFVTLVGGTLIVALALWLEVVYEPPIWVYAVVLLPLTLIFCLGTLRPLKGVLIALQFRNKAEQGKFEL